jgi:hypothetical protein
MLHRTGAFSIGFEEILPTAAAALGAAEMLLSLGPLKRRVVVLRHDLLFASPVFSNPRMSLG